MRESVPQVVGRAALEDETRGGVGYGKNVVRTGRRDRNGKAFDVAVARHRVPVRVLRKIDLALERVGDIQQRRRSRRHLEVTVGEAQVPDVADRYGTGQLEGHRLVMRFGVRRAASPRSNRRRIRIDVEAVDVVAVVAGAAHLDIGRGGVNLRPSRHHRKMQVADVRVIECEEILARLRDIIEVLAGGRREHASRRRIVAELVLEQGRHGEEEGILGVLLDGGVQLVIHALGHAINTKRIDRRHLDVVRADLEYLRGKARIAVEGAARVREVEACAYLRDTVVLVQGRQLRQLRIERLAQLVEPERTDPVLRIAPIVAVVDVEADPDAVRAGRTEHLLRHLERVEVRIAVSGAEDGRMRNGRGVGDVGVEAGVPLRGAEVLAQEDRIMYRLLLVADRRTEVTDEDDCLGQPALLNDYVDAERGKVGQLLADLQVRAGSRGVELGIYSRGIIDGILQANGDRVEGCGGDGKRRAADDGCGLGRRRHDLRRDEIHRPDLAGNRQFRLDAGSG